MEVKIEHYKVTSLPSNPKPNSIYWIKASSDSDVKGYITDFIGTPFPLKDLGTTFNPSDYDLSEFTNTSGDPFAKLSDLNFGIISSIVAGTNISINNTDPENPIISVTGLSDVATSGDYTDLNNIPTTFTPSLHTHVEADITDLDKYTQSETNTFLFNKEDKVSGVVAFGSDNYTATVPEVTELVFGYKILCAFENTNTGASTINVNGLGVKEIRKEIDVQLVADDLKGVRWLMYDGNHFQVASHFGSGGGGYFIPLTGTEVGSPITGQLKFTDNGEAQLISDSADVKSGVYVLDSSVQIVQTEDDFDTINSFIFTKEDGISSSEDHSSNITDLCYPQKIYVDSKIGNLHREEFTFIGSQTFTLANNYGQVYSVEVQGQGALSTSQYTLVAPNQITINDTLDTGDYVVVIYSNSVAGLQPYYSQAETDALITNNIKVWKSGIDGVTVADTLTITPTYTQLIPANTFQSGDVVELSFRSNAPAGKTSASSNYLYINTTSDLVTGSPLQLAISTSVATARTVSLDRTLSIKAGGLRVINPALSLATDKLITTSGASSAMTLPARDWTIDQYFIFAIGHTANDQTLTGDFYRIIKN